MTIDGVEVVSYWASQGVTNRTQCDTPLTRIAGTYNIVVEYYENSSNSATAKTALATS